MTDPGRAPGPAAVAHWRPPAPRCPGRRQDTVDRGTSAVPSSPREVFRRNGPSKSSGPSTCTSGIVFQPNRSYRSCVTDLETSPRTAPVRTTPSSGSDPAGGPAAAAPAGVAAGLASLGQRDPRDPGYGVTGCNRGLRRASRPGARLRRLGRAGRVGVSGWPGPPRSPGRASPGAPGGLSEERIRAGFAPGSVRLGGRQHSARPGRRRMTVQRHRVVVVGGGLRRHRRDARPGSRRRRRDDRGPDQPSTSSSRCSIRWPPGPWPRG